MLEKKVIEKLSKYELSPEQRVALLEDKLRRAEQSIQNLARLKQRMDKHTKYRF